MIVIYILIAAFAFWLICEHDQRKRSADEISSCIASLSIAVTDLKNCMGEISEREDNLNERLESAEKICDDTMKAAKERAESEAELNGEQLKTERLFQQGMNSILNYDYRTAGKRGGTNE